MPYLVLVLKKLYSIKFICICSLWNKFKLVELCPTHISIDICIVIISEERVIVLYIYIYLRGRGENNRNGNSLIEMENNKKESTNELKITV